MYAGDIPWLVKQMASSPDLRKPIETEMIAPMGATLGTHWERGEVTRALRRAKWDFVLLQEQSTVPIENPGLMSRYARLLDGEIRASGAKTILFMTWSREQHPETLQQLTNTYRNVAKDIRATVAPVGLVWQDVMKTRPSLRLYHEDGSHPSPVGSYLAACVLYSTIFDKSPVGLPATLHAVRQDGSHIKAGELSSADAALIQSAAWERVRAERSKGNSS
jgi:hypothetical protein